MEWFYTENNTVFCRAFDKAANIRHGFSTREGGISKLEHTKSMNLAYDRGDGEDTVNKNRMIFAKNVGFDADDLVSGAQTHSTNVIYADGNVKLYENTDGLVTDKPGVFIAVKTADCQPILFYEPEADIVGACHAGWRGTMGEIARKTVEKMEALGADKEKIIAALGPCIHKCCFEVKEDFISEFEKNAKELLPFIEKRGDGSFADMPKMNEFVLLKAGLKREHIHVCPDCTCCNSEKYFSHRKTGGKRGTMMAVIGKIF